MVSLHYSNYKSFVDFHVESILEYCRKPGRRKFKLSRLDVLVDTHFGRIVADFESLLKAGPHILERVKHEFEYNKTEDEQAIIKDSFDVRGLYKYFVDDEFHNSRKNVNYGSRYLADKLDVFTCAYCNENFTYYFSYKGATSIRRTFDWDHIYAQNLYPFLAISFFNLVPCCKICNQIKLDQDEGFYNPHLDIDVNDIYQFLLSPTAADFITDSKKIQLDLLFANRRYKNEIKTTINVVGLLSRMRQHKELVKDILNRKFFFPNPYLESVAGTISKLNPEVTEGQLKKTLYGVHFNHQEYYKRPFSKLTDDILRKNTRI